MNYEENQTILDLITDYEASLERGEVIFLDEKSYLQLIEYYETEDRLDRALEVIERAIKTHHYSVDFYIKKAQLLIDDQQDAQALLVLEQADNLAPAEPEIALLRVEALANVGLYFEAFNLLNDLKKEAENELLTEVYVQEALVYETMSEHERAFQSLRSALLVDPHHREALERIWLCIELTKKYDESVALHKELIDLAPYSYLAWYNLGHAQAYLGNYNEAIEAYEYAFIINEKFEFAYRDCAELCFEIKKYRKALRCYLELLEQTSPDTELYCSIGQCYQQLEAYPSARTFYLKALQSDPLNDEVYFYLGECYAEEGRLKNAVRFYKKAIKIEQNREEYFAAIAEAYAELGDLKKAETNFKKAIDLAPDQIEYWMQYTSFLIEYNRMEEALHTLEEAEDFALGTELLYCRIACLFALGHRQEAFYWLGEALLEDFDMHSVLFGLMPTLESDSEVIAVIADHLG